ncbi:unnamed protein product [Diabrotica balteata]|uniref:Uncharacterized protein n=1 Tax=Diabrotica balteata TaxID=107213 RepID=A0A9N9XJW1_DIABA|nr:unnamed protein product [Diabrotica balteata]
MAKLTFVLLALVAVVVLTTTEVSAKSVKGVPVFKDLALGNVGAPCDSDICSEICQSISSSITGGVCIDDKCVCY